MELLKQLIAETSKKDVTDIFLAGKEAAHSRAPKKNPYEIFSTEWNAWEDGYRSGKNERTFEAEEDDNWPKLISHADEFRVEMDKDEQIHLLDGEGKIRVSMPLVIWKQLCR